MLARSLMLDGGFSLENYRHLLATERSWRLLGNSLGLALATALASTFVGLPLGLLFAKTDLPLRGVFVLLFTLPLVIPPYITAVSWANMLGSRGLALKYSGRGDSSSCLALAVRFAGLRAGHGVHVHARCHAGDDDLCENGEPRLEEAARLSARPLRVLCGITVPLMRPGLVLAATLVFLLALGEFGAPQFLRYAVFPVESFTQFSALL